MENQQVVPIQVTVDYIFPIPFMRMNLRDQMTPLILSEIETIKANYASSSDDFIQNIHNNLMTKHPTVLNGTKLGEILQFHLDSYSTHVLGEEPTLKITTSWLNYHHKNSAHDLHFHPNSKVSGCFYVNCNDNSGDFVIHKPPCLHEQYLNTKVNPNEFTYTYIQYKPQMYDLYIFPSFVQHSVEVNRSDESRVSLAFNSFYSKTFGNDAYNRIFLKE